MIVPNGHHPLFRSLKNPFSGYIFFNMRHPIASLRLLFTTFIYQERNLLCRPSARGRRHWLTPRSPWQTCCLGLVLLTLTASVRADLWPAEAGPAHGWKSLPWFGTFYSTSSGDDWIYHQYHGWNYALGEGPHSFYLYMPDRARWTWTAEGIYPWVYEFGGDTWLYYADESQAPRWFYNAAMQTWQTAPTEILTRVLLAEKVFPDSVAVDTLPPRDFSAVDDDEAEPPFNAQLGFIASNEVFSETANVYPQEDMTAVLRLELTDGVFGEGDFIHIRLHHRDSSGGFAPFTLSTTEDRLTLEPFDEEALKPFAPLPVGANEIVWGLFQSGMFTTGEYRLMILAEIDGRLYRAAPERLWVNPAEPSPAPENLIADTGFRPVPHGFGFPNFTSILEGVLTPREVADLLGSGMVIERANGDEPVLTPMARHWRAQVLESGRNGHCLGLAFASFLLFQGDLSGSPYAHKSSPADFDPAVGQIIELQQAPVRNLITYYFAVQYSGRFFQEITSFEAMPPSEVLDGYIESIQNGTPAPVLLLRNRNGTGGHGVTPYAVSKAGDDLYHIHIYDNNFPADHSLFIEINRGANTWVFHGIRPATGETYEPYEGYLDFSGAADTNNLAYLPHDFLATFERELDSRLLVSASAPAELFIFQDDHQIGFDFNAGDYVNNFPGADFRAVYDSNQPPAYILPGEPLPPDTGMDEVFDSMIFVKVGIPAEDGEDPGASHSVNVMAGTDKAGAAVKGMNLRRGDTAGLAFHQSGRVAGLIADDSPVIPEAFRMKVDDPDEPGGYIFAITDLTLEPDNGLILIVDENFELFPVFIEDLDSAPGPPPEGLYNLSVIRVTAQGEEIIIHSVNRDSR